MEILNLVVYAQVDVIVKHYLNKIMTKTQYYIYTTC